MKVEIAEGDMRRELTSDELSALGIAGDVMGGAKKRECGDFIGAVIKVVTRKATRYVPDGWGVSECCVEVAFEGKPFGVGVSGTVAVTMTRAG